MHSPSLARSSRYGAALLAVLTAACSDPAVPADSSRPGDASLDARGDSALPGVDVAPRVDTGPPVCGDGHISAGEVCDDNNTHGGDGCSPDCHTIEPGFICPEQGMACVSTATCGDGILGGTEQCDDHNVMPGDGCTAMCTLEAGWTCALPGAACRAARCGDGLRVDAEECDDHNMMPGDGCSATCTLEDGFQCPTPGMMCTGTRCGDRMVQGTEQCDDGNNVLGDGCDPFCRREPQCTSGTCTAVCGDGVRQTGEDCDDGNTRPNDGCSATCVHETGFACTDRTSDPMSLAVPIVYRDFRGNDLSGGHIDFENGNGGETGIVAANLSSTGRLVYAPGASGTTATTHGQTTFNQWYTDTAGVNRTLIDRLTLSRTGPGIYVFDNGAFFPLDGRGWMTDGMEPARDGGHNFSFTSELRYWFTYAGGEQLAFRGDDDVWVFINGHLAVDLGGVHGAQDGAVTLDSMAAMQFGLRTGGTYEAVVFQAERHTSASSYRLTLEGFNAPRSVCASRCGDAIVARDEVCDDGHNDGSYGGCAPGCHMLGPRCGDGTIQRDHSETCDDGNRVSGDGCSATCQSEDIG